MKLSFISDEVNSIKFQLESATLQNKNFQEQLNAVKNERNSLQEQLNAQIEKNKILESQFRSKSFNPYSTFCRSIKTEKKQYFQSLFINRTAETTDYTFELLDGTKYFAHKFILNQNPGFQQIIKNNQSSYKLSSNFSESTITHFISFFYGETQPQEIVSNDVIHEIFLISNTLKIEIFQNFCIDLMQTNIKPQNLTSFLHCSILSNNSQLQQSCLKMFHNNYYEIIILNSFKTTSYAAMKLLFKTPINSNQQNTFIQVRNWIIHNKILQEDAKVILNSINYKSMTPQFFKVVAVFFKESSINDVIDIEKVYKSITKPKICRFQEFYSCEIINQQENTIKATKDDAWAYTSPIDSVNVLVNLTFFGFTDEKEVIVSFVNDSIDELFDKQHSLFEFPIIVKKNENILINLSPETIKFIKNQIEIKEFENKLQEFVRVYFKLSAGTKLSISTIKIEEDDKPLSRLEKPVIKGPDLVFSLNKATIHGPGLIVLDNNLTVEKIQTSHCSILSSNSFKSGIHRFKVCFGPRKP